METFYSSDRLIWRKWLEENFETKTEIWFIFPQKGAAEPAMAYNDAVEEALCFGWIDSTIKHTDPLHRAQRFTPRRKGSAYSQPNMERLIWLYGKGLIHKKVLPEVLPLIMAPFSYPEEILEALRKDAAVWENYCRFSEPYKRIRVAYIKAAEKRPEEYEKRLRNFISKTRENKIIRGFGGIEKYYR